MEPPRRSYRSHYLPRSRSGWWSLLSFLLLFAMTQPPVVTGPANRIEPLFLGLPFLYSWLLVIYGLLILVLVRALGKGL